MLTGSYARALDEKLRVAIPKRWRDQLGHPQQAHVYLAPGTDGSLALYNEAAFSRLADRLADGSPTGQDIRDFSRLFYAQAQLIEIDKQGRIRVPLELARHAHLGKEIVLLGVRDHLELWDQQRWEDYLQSKQQRYDELAERAFQPAGALQSADKEKVTEQRPAQPR